jgi:transposase
LIFHARVTIVERVRKQGRPQAHVAEERGVSRRTVAHWVARQDAEGEAGLHERSSRPRISPRRSSARVEEQVLALREKERRGQDWLGPELGVPPRTVSRIPRRHRVAYLRELDPTTGEVIRSSKATAIRYEYDRPGQLVRMDVKKIGRIPDGRLEGPRSRRGQHQPRPGHQGRVRLRAPLGR